MCIGGAVVFICILATYFGYMGNPTDLHCLVRVGEHIPIPLPAVPSEMDAFITKELKNVRVVDVTA